MIQRLNGSLQTSVGFKAFDIGIVHKRMGIPRNKNSNHIVQHADSFQDTILKVMQ